MFQTVVVLPFLCKLSMWSNFISKCPSAFLNQMVSVTFFASCHSNNFLQLLLYTGGLGGPAGPGIPVTGVSNGTAGGADLILQGNRSL